MTFSPTLESLYEQATACRDEAHIAYQAAMRNGAGPAVVDQAWRVLLAANLVQSNLYAAILNGITEGTRS